MKEQEREIVKAAMRWYRRLNLRKVDMYYTKSDLALWKACDAHARQTKRSTQPRN